MTLEEALANLIEYYCEEEDHHAYIRESWRTLKAHCTQPTVHNKQSTPYFCTCISGRDKPKIIVAVCPECQGMLW